MLCALFFILGPAYVLLLTQAIRWRSGTLRVEIINVGGSRRAYRARAARRFLRTFGARSPMSAVTSDRSATRVAAIMELVREGAPVATGSLLSRNH